MYVFVSMTFPFQFSDLIFTYTSYDSRKRTCAHGKEYSVRIIIFSILQEASVWRERERERDGGVKCEIITIKKKTETL